MTPRRVILLAVGAVGAVLIAYSAVRLSGPSQGFGDLVFLPVIAAGLLLIVAAGILWSRRPAWAWATMGAWFVGAAPFAVPMGFVALLWPFFIWGVDDLSLVVTTLGAAAGGGAAAFLVARRASR